MSSRWLGKYDVSDDYDFYNQIYDSDDSDQSLIEGDEIDVVEQDCETRVNTWLQSVDSSEVSSESTVQDSAIPNTDQNTVTEEHTGKLHVNISRPNTEQI